MQRRRFSREFKIEAVKLVRERGVSMAQAGEDLSVHENVHRSGNPGPTAAGCIRRCRAAYTLEASPLHGLQKPSARLVTGRILRAVAHLLGIPDMHSDRACVRAKSVSSNARHQD